MSIIFIFLSAVHMYDFHIFTSIDSSIHGFSANQHNDQLSVGFLAQLVEHNTVSQRSWAQIPYRPEFSNPLFTNASVVIIDCEDRFHIKTQYYNLTKKLPHVR